MTSIRFFQWPLIIFLLGVGIRWIGTLFKIRHYPYADELLLTGTIIGVCAVLFAIIKLLALKKQ